MSLTNMLADFCYLTVVKQTRGDVLSYRSKSVGIPFEQK